MTIAFIRLLFIFACCTSLTYAWWCEGHMLILEIAKQILIQEKKDNVMTYINEALQYMKEKDAFQDFHNISCWMDGIKDDGGMSWSGPLHYTDIPYIVDNCNFTLVPYMNITGALREAIYTLSQKPVHSYMTGETAKSIALRMLIHLMADIHQPLHTTSRVRIESTTKKCKADDGGNGFKVVVPNRSDIQNLHYLWDSILGLTQGLVPLIANVIKNATEIITAYPKSTFATNLTLTEINQWAQESYGISVANVYKDLKEGDTVPTSYITANIQVAKKQLALGGYRLAQQFEKAYAAKMAMELEDAMEGN